MFRRSALEMRVVVLAPIGRDAALLSGTLQAMAVDTAIAPDATTLLTMLSEGAGSAIIGEEGLTPTLIEGLSAWIASQPPWSDPPLIVLTLAGKPTRESHRRAIQIQTLGNATLIERPVRPETLQSSVRTALRARMRQYEIRSRQEALVQANADLEQFAHSASHDLREPLRSVGVYSELLARDYIGILDERGMQFLTEIRSGVKRMDALLSDLQAYAHASSISEQSLEPVSALGPLNEALQNLAGAIQECDAHISVGEMPAVRMRASHMCQIFQNLIGNAIKYRSKNVPLKIQLSAERKDGEWVFSVVDNGIGIPAAYTETIFGIFKRLHSNNTYSGTGMGLAICQRIVERYRGRIWVESEPGHGSNFRFTIPA